MTVLEQLIYDFLIKNTLMTMLDTDEAREYTEEKAKELAKLIRKKFVMHDLVQSDEGDIRIN